MIRGARYVTSANQPLVDFIQNDLKYLDFDAACDFYDSNVPSIDHMGRALLGCNDRFFLLSHLLNRPDVKHPWLFNRCREVEKHPDGHLDLWARYHYKSTIITFAGTIQEILCDPEVTIAIFSHTKPIASAFLDQIKTEFEQNAYLKMLYSDVLWDRPRVEARKWSTDEGITVKRRSNPREATVEAHGLVDGQPTSRHYALLIYDDIVTEKTVTGPEQIKKATKAWENSDNLGQAEGVRKWHAGTRWSFGDPYGVIIERKILKERRYPATDDGTLRGAPVFLTQARWEEVKRSQRSTVAAQMLLNPVAGSEAVFLPRWFRTYEIIPAILNVYIMCDPAKRKSKAQNRDSDRTAISVVGIDQHGNKYLLDGYRHRMRLSERYRYMDELHRKWEKHPGVQMVRVGYEQYGVQADLEVIEEYQERNKRYFEVEELNYPREGGHSKNDRIERLEPDMKSGRFYMPGVVYHPEVCESEEEMRVTRGVCTWLVWDEEAQKKADEANKQVPYQLDQIIYRPLRTLTRSQRYYEAIGQRYRIVHPIRRRDEDGEVYDVTRCLMEEARFHPYAPHDDFLDATSRIYDMEPCKPVVYEASDTEGTSEDSLPEGLSAYEEVA